MPANIKQKLCSSHMVHLSMKIVKFCTCPAHIKWFIWAWRLSNSVLVQLISHGLSEHEDCQILYLSSSSHDMVQKSWS